MNNAVFGKTVECVKKHRDSKLVTTERRTNYLGSESNHHTTKFFTEHLLAIVMKKTEILVNKAVCLGFSILELSKILMYQFCYDYVKSKYGKKAKLCYMDTDLFIVYIKTDDIYKDNAKDVKARFETPNYELERPLPKRKNKRLLFGLMKDELGGKIMTKVVGLRAKTYSYLIDDTSQDKKQKAQKSVS